MVAVLLLESCCLPRLRWLCYSTAAVYGSTREALRLFWECSVLSPGFDWVPFSGWGFRRLLIISILVFFAFFEPRVVLLMEELVG